MMDFRPGQQSRTGAFELPVRTHEASACCGRLVRVRESTLETLSKAPSSPKAAGSTVAMRSAWQIVVDAVLGAGR